VTALAMVLFVAWVRACATVWLERSAQGRVAPRQALVAATIAASLLLAGLLGYMSFTVASGIVALPAIERANLGPLTAELGFLADLTPEQSVLVIVFGVGLLQLSWLPLTPLALAMTWAFPLAAGALSPHDQDRPRWRRVCATSVLAGVGALIAFLAYTFAMADPENVSAFVIVAPSVFGVFQVVAALSVQARVAQQSVFHALATAQLTGLVTVGLLVGLFGLAGTELGWEAVGTLATSGLLLASIAALIFAPILAWMRRKQPLAVAQPAR
jgi:hypothetical protein